MPYLLDHGFVVVESGDVHHGYVLLRRTDESDEHPREG